MRFMAVLSGLLLAATAFAQNISTPVFVLKDGDATAAGYSGTDKSIYVDGGTQQSVGWITFQTQGIDVSKVASAKLVLYVNALTGPGTLQARLLTADIAAPENNVRLTEIPADVAITTTLALGTTNIGNVIQLDLTAAIKSGTFKGIALMSDDGLAATFDSKEGHLKPMVLLTNNVNDVAAVWLSGNSVPAVGIGKDGDYYLNTASGDVSAKAGGAWSVVTNIVGATGAAGAKGDKGDAGSNGANGVAGSNGTNGATGPQGSFPTGTTAGDMQYWNGSAWVMIPAGQPGQSLKGMGSSIPQWTNIPGTVADIDGNVYRTIVIGNQEWTITNLRTTRYKNGTPITLDTGTSTWGTGTTGKYCYYTNTTDAGAQQKYGALYNWYAVSSGNLAPAGWRVPDTTDWNNLENYLISNGYNYDGTTSGNKIAKSMAAGLWTTSATAGAIGNNLSTNNKSGFSALGGGYRHNVGNFYSQSVNGCWWSAAESGASNAWYRYLYCDSGYLYRSYDYKSCGYSVRLLRDLN